MSTSKFVKFAAPYNSQTFNSTHGLIIGVSGVLSGGTVTTSGMTVTVQPLTFVQNGLIVAVTSPLSANLPVSLRAPYFLAVTTSSSIENLAEVITPTFAKRPEDVTDNTVLVAEWDGQEWRQLPYIDIRGIVAAQATQALKENMVGIASGFDSSQDSNNIYLTPGAAHASDGSFIIKEVTSAINKVLPDPDSLDRVDELVLRKPSDDPARIAALSLVVGPTFSGDTPQLFTPQQLSAAASSAVKTLNSPTSDDFYFFYLEGTTLLFTYSTNALSTFAAPTTIASNVDSYDAVLNPAGSLDLIYTRNTDVFYKRISATGTTVFAESTVYTNPQQVANAKISPVLQGSDYFLHVVFEQRISVSQRNLMYLRLSSANTVETQAILLLNQSATLINPSLDKDDDDVLLLLAFENQDTGAVYLQVFDVGTATASSAPTPLAAPLILQDSTFDISSSALLASSGATNPVVKRTTNKETYVFWRHPTGSGKFGVGIYNSHYLADLGYKAVLRDLFTAGENVDQFAVSVDGLNVAHLILLEQGLVGAANLVLETMAVSEVVTVAASGATDINTIFSSRGALVHSYANAVPSSNIVKSTAGIETTLRDRYLPPTDVYMVHYRNSDGVLSTAGTALEEDTTIRRLYEFNNMFASTGTVTWTGSSGHTLVINEDLTVNFFNRFATYTIPANDPGGINVPDGSVCFVFLPDDDSSQALSLEILPFGEGHLDRYGRLAVPLFWSIAGVLYTKFAPFRLDAGGATVIIGEGGINPAVQQWLGLPSLLPDPSNHNYSSTLVINNTMDYNTALGALDTVVGTVIKGIVSGNDTIPANTTSHTFTIDTPQVTSSYRLLPNWDNEVDSDPLFQPITITEKTLTTFTATWNYPTDSANYTIDYILISASTVLDMTSANVPLNLGDTTVNVVFGTARGVSTYRVVPSFANLVDSDPLFQPITISNKTVNGFTATWNMPLDSANYSLDYITKDS